MFAIEHNYPVKILYFALEDTREKIMKKIICHYLYERNKIQLSFHDMNSRFKVLDPKILTLLEQDTKFYETLEKVLYIIDNASSPNFIRDACTKYQTEGIIKENDHTIVLIDNYDNVTPDKEDKDKWTAINRLSAQIVRLDLCKKRNFSVTSVLQVDL